MKHITVNNYNIYIDNNILNNVDKYIKEVYKNKKIYIITDTVIEKLYLKQLTQNLGDYKLNTVIIESLEKNKTLKTYEKIVSNLIEKNITRDSLIIGFGGGIIGDVSAYVASTILRGVKYISIPTTLLSQVDSSIGGKTGLNFNNVKNVIGTFYEPSLVLIDPNLLSSLSKEEFNNGLGEVIKCGFIKDKEILSLLQGNFDLEDLIYRSLIVKKSFVEGDLYDKKKRMILNFGHTFGHVIELEKNIKHGFAVIEGMIMALTYGHDLKINNDSSLKELYKLLEILNIKYLNLDYKNYLNKLGNDKKNIENKINFIFLEEIGNPIIKQIER